MSIAQSCKSSSDVDYWMPEYLTEDQAYIMEELADIILPATDTPGAIDAGVINFMDVVIGNVYDAKEKDIFQKAYNAFLSRASSSGDGKDLDREKLDDHLAKYYEGKTEEDMDKIMELIRTDDPPEDEALHDDYYYHSFIYGIKRLSIAGYFGSELIGEEYLSYDPIPGAYLGCIPLSDVGNTWSL